MLTLPGSEQKAASRDERPRSSAWAWMIGWYVVQGMAEAMPSGRGLTVCKEGRGVMLAIWKNRRKREQGRYRYYGLGRWKPIAFNASCRRNTIFAKSAKSRPRESGKRLNHWFLFGESGLTVVLYTGTPYFTRHSGGQDLPIAEVGVRSN